jgi:hypothetical protein
MLAAPLFALALAAGPVKVDLWNDLSEDVVVTTPGGVAAPIPKTKDASFAAPSGTKTMIITYKGCDYPIAWPDAVDAFVDQTTGSVRLYLSDTIEIYVVPSDLILQTPPNFLDPRQPNQFPIYPGPQVCKKS